MLVYAVYINKSLKENFSGKLMGKGRLSDGITIDILYKLKERLIGDNQ